MGSHNNKKIDYVFKAAVIRNGMDKTERELSKKCYFKGDFTEYMDMTKQMILSGNDKAWKEAHKINHATYERRKRLEKRITSFLLDKETGVINECIFITLTFTDKTLESTTSKKRRELVQRYLKSQGVPYVANIDFGAKNNREHYHALVKCGSVDYEGWHRYGAVKGERIKVLKDCNVKLAKYIAKLTNHAIKETTHRQALIYSR